ncbi:hypothetical protein VQH23_26520 (plasmid) [Pararoseomonas sp. SCSIO 73927]|uniref:hypothetical protein n=1 Tax=Pararoseomonas sp. SCSIO 73927 TaxID=3114537 RepID=UPI0030CE3842
MPTKNPASTALAVIPQEPALPEAVVALAATMDRARSVKRRRAEREQQAALAEQEAAEAARAADRAAVDHELGTMDGPSLDTVHATASEARGRAADLRDTAGTVSRAVAEVEEAVTHAVPAADAATREIAHQHALQAQADYVALVPRLAEILGRMIAADEALGQGYIAHTIAQAFPAALDGSAASIAPIVPEDMNALLQARRIVTEGESLSREVERQRDRAALQVENQRRLATAV